MPCSRSSKLHNNTCHKWIVQSGLSKHAVWHPTGQEARVLERTAMLRTPTQTTQVYPFTPFPNISITMNVWPLHIDLDISLGECTGRMPYMHPAVL
jgi:hypothetical protein